MDPHQAKIIEAAHRLGIQVEELEDDWKIDVIRLSWKKKSILVTLGRVFDHLSTVANEVAANKIASKALMAELGIPTPAYIILDSSRIERKSVRAFLTKYKPVVAKPSVGTDGFGVAMHLEQAEQVIEYITNFSSPPGLWLLEQQATGDDLRLQYLNGKLIAACIRKPCTLIGDGKSTINSLIRARNQLIRAQNPNNKIEIDHQVQRRLETAGLHLNSILPSNQELQVKDVSNMSQGGHAIDVTNRVHQKYQKYLDSIAEVLDMRFFSLDVMTTDPEADPELHARVLEFNAQPAWLHHTFSERRQHDLAILILKELFEIDER